MPAYGRQSEALQSRLLIPELSKSLVALAAMEEGQKAARIATPWALCMRSGDPQAGAAALCCMGLHLKEVFWQFEIADEVDRLGAALQTKTTESD